MFDDDIEVAKIMRAISIMEENFNYDTVEDLMKIRFDMACLIDNIKNNKSNIEPYLAMGMRIPKFSSFPSIIRPILIVLTRLVRKATLYMTREQTIVNTGLYQLMGDLAKQNEYNQKLIFTILHLYFENKNLKNTVKHYQAIVEKLQKNE